VAEYLGVRVHVPENDREHLEYLQAAGEGRLALQRCSDCGHLRYPPGPACPLCRSLDSEWSDVSGRGTIYSYEIVAHAIHPAYRERAPYPVVLVELEEQRGVPSEHDALRIVASLVDEEGRPEDEERVAIGAPVEVEFADVGDGLGLPRFRLSAA
jgi:uncharacterized OB-fold protein